MNILRIGVWVLAGLFLTLSPLFAHAATLPKAVVAAPVATCTSAGSPQITLSWPLVSGASSYSVFRSSASSAAWTNIASKQTTASFVDKGVLPGTKYQYQVKSWFRFSTTFSNIVSVQTPVCTSSTPTSTQTAPPPGTTTPATTGQTTFSAYITGYGWPDNTPAGADVSDGVIHTSAGGAGTYADPITMAVGHSIINGKDILDYPKGTKFYIPALHRYFIVEDTCGDGSQPQNGPCHTGFEGKPWLDLWVGGQGINTSTVFSCEDKITNVHTVIQNPRSNYVVISGPIANTACTLLYAETPLTI